MAVIEKYSPQYQSQVKELVTGIHSEFGFPYKPKYDYDLENPSEFYNDAGGMFFILVENGKVIGSSAIKKRDDTTAELKRMYLKPEYRGKGWGSKLFDEACRFAEGAGFSKLVLDTNIQQLKAQTFYLSKGFKESRREGRTIFMEKDI